MPLRGLVVCKNKAQNEPKPHVGWRGVAGGLLAGFSFVLRPFAYGLSGLVVVVGRLVDGSHEAFALCSRSDGQSDAVRLEYSPVVALAEVMDQAQYEAQGLMPTAHLPVVWVASSHPGSRSTELSAVHGAVEIALRTVKSPGVLAVLARVGAPAAMSSGESAQA